MRYLRELTSLFRPRAVAVVGASKDPAKIGNAILRNMQKCGFAGRLFPVNPREKEIGGLPCYPGPAQLPEVPEVAVISVPVPAVAGVAEECGRAGIRYLVVVTAGFKETGGEGLAREKELLAICRRHGMRLVGPNCVGIMDTHTPMNASFASSFPRPGKIAFISQSGAFVVAILDWSFQTGLGFSRFVSLGNKADLNEADFIEEAARDEETRVILCYIEDVADGPRFIEAARSASRQKPVIVLKSGTSASGARAASSHTGALAGSDLAYSAAFRHAGVIRAGSMAELFDLAGVFATQPLPAGRRVAVVTNSGGPGIVATDAVEQEGLEMARFDRATIDALREFLPAESNVYNPVDVLGDARSDRYRRAMAAVLGDGHVDAMLVMTCPAAVTEPEETAAALVECAARHPAKPVVAAFMGGPQMDRGAQFLRERGIPAFTFPEPGIRALKGLHAYHAGKAALENPQVLAFDNIDPAAVEEVLKAAAEEKRPVLLPSEAARVARAYGITTAPTRLAATCAEAVRLADEMGYPVVLKVASPKIMHKTDVGGVVTGVPNAAAVRQAWDTVMGNVLSHFPLSVIYGIEVQKMMPPGVELIVGITRDVHFGHMVAFGLGGIYVNLLQDVSFRLTQGLTPGEIQEMIRETRAFTLLRGYRGEAPADLEAVAGTIGRVAVLVQDFPTITEMDINPVFAYAKGVAALDIKITVGG